MTHRDPFQPLPFCDSVILDRTKFSTSHLFLQKDEAAEIREPGLWPGGKAPLGRPV